MKVIYAGLCLTATLVASTGQLSGEVPAPMPQPGPGPTAPPKPTDPQPVPPSTPQPPLMPGSPKSIDLSEVSVWITPVEKEQMNHA